jgi:molybdopterin molybdotransferase
MKEKKDASEPVLGVRDALKRIMSAVVPVAEQEDVPLFEMDGRVLAADVIATVDIPMVDNSAMDGYAILASDTNVADRSSPARLAIIGEAQAGSREEASGVSSGRSVRIMTGAAIPPGADAVVQFEDTSEDGNLVLIYRKVARHENIRFAGEDIRENSVVLRKGTRLKSADIGLLASLNYSFARVSRKPRVAVVSTGDEIIEVGSPIEPGQIRNSNAYTLYHEVKRCGAEPFYMGIAGDTIEKTRVLLDRAAGYDVVITTGGVSMGRYDFVKDAVRNIGFELQVENIRMRPGKPCVFGKRGNVLFFGLPGNPVSTMVSFTQFVRPALLAMMGARCIDKPFISAILDEDIRKKGGRTYFIRGYFVIKGGDFHVSTTGPQGSGILRSMSDANCLIMVPEELEGVRRGDRVDIQLIHHEEI